MVDRNDQPGGHWTTAYPFVRLHQPSAYYGVNSRNLGSDTIDHSGLNAGYYELASGAEVCAYFDAVMRQHLLPTGRVTYLPMSEYLGDGRVRTLGGEDIEVTARRVVTSHVEIIVPSMRRPSYAVAPGVECVPPNDLPRIRDARDRYVIVGAGKTAMDACLWLLRHGVAPQRLTWIKPRDSWILDRAAIQPGSQFAKRVLRDFSDQLHAVHEAESLPDLFDRLEAKGCLHAHRPVRRPDDVPVRDPVAGRTRRAAAHRRRGADGPCPVDRAGPHHARRRDAATSTAQRSTSTAAQTVSRASRPTTVFTDDHISLQAVRTCQPAFSAAVIAHVEAAYPDDDTRNAFCGPVPYPHEPTDWLRMMLAFNRNQLQWFSDPDMMAWVDAARLNVLHHVSAAVSERAREKIISVLNSQMPAINDKLETLLAQARDRASAFRTERLAHTSAPRPATPPTPGAAPRTGRRRGRSGRRARRPRRCGRARAPAPGRRPAPWTAGAR